MAHYLSVYRLPHFNICTFLYFPFLSTYLLLFTSNIFTFAHFHLSTLYYCLIEAFIHFHVYPFLHSQYIFMFIHFYFQICTLHYIFFVSTFFCLHFYRTIQSVHLNLADNIFPHHLFFLSLILWLSIIVSCLFTYWIVSTTSLTIFTYNFFHCCYFHSCLYLFIRYIFCFYLFHIIHFPV